MSAYVQPIWLKDARAKPWIRRNLPGFFLYFTRLIIWVILGVAVYLQFGNKPIATIAWVSWMILGACVYHRYVAGGAPTSWIACSIAAILTLLLVGNRINQQPLFKLDSWADLFKVMLFFFLIWGFLALTLRIRIFQRPFSRMYKRRDISSLTDVEKYSQELQNDSIFRRFTTLAQLQVLQLNCDSNVWAETVYETISASSIAIADLTSITSDAALMWEIDQALNAGVPIVFTCEVSAINGATSALEKIGQTRVNIFTWAKGKSALDTISYDFEQFSKHFFECVQTHRASELAYLSIRFSRSEALERLNQL